MKKQLPERPIPEWILSVDKDSEFSIANVLENSIYYPACNTDGSMLEAFGGFAHSFVYADPNITKEQLIKRIPKVAGYSVLFTRDILKEQLCFKPFNLVRPIPEIDGDPKEFRITDEFKPYALWVVFQRNSFTNPSHGPKRLSLLFIAGEGIATYQAIYNSNKIRPLAIVLYGHSGFAGNWTFFERRDGIFERSVMANLGGFPSYIFADEHYDNEWTERPLSTWSNYTKLYKKTSFIKIWEASRVNSVNES